ncbi:hypothetical protein [Streptomyces cucumeris]|uniref:hypothetical protein n=1 Tax=Streptomyces cucumeris TaxID=2962890 RepID=UPI0020C85B80|nr:hypothetical protein [Streptomyces sp. NEAU-Y11]MCP9209531.1 hypothetical protein [Streptomyces sp. NEAU-Y11]
MEFYSGPAVVLVDGEEFEVYAFIDSMRGMCMETWGGYLETGEHGEAIRLLALRAEEAYVRLPGSSARDIGALRVDECGVSFIGLSPSPLPVPIKRPDGV